MWTGGAGVSEEAGASLTLPIWTTNPTAGRRRSEPLINLRDRLLARRLAGVPGNAEPGEIAWHLEVAMWCFAAMTSASLTGEL